MAAAVATASGSTASQPPPLPDKPSIESIEQGKSITYGQFRSLTNRIAQYLKARGIGPNDRVAMLSGNTIEHLATYIGTMAYGATICTIHVEMNAVYFEQILNAIGPRLTLYEVGGEQTIDVATLSTTTPGEWMELGCTGLKTTLRVTGEPVERARLDLGSTTLYRLEDLLGWFEVVHLTPCWHMAEDSTALFLLKRAATPRPLAR